MIKAFGKNMRSREHGGPPERTNRARGSLTREAAKRSMETLEDLQGSTHPVG